MTTTLNLKNNSQEAMELTEEVVTKAYQDFPRSELAQLKDALAFSHMSLIECRYYAEGEARKRADEQIKRNEQILGL